jgi:hypothetical protein
MSIAASSRMAFTAVSNDADPSFRPASETPTVKSAIETVTQWIPTEAVGIYIAAVGIFAPEHMSGRWLLFGLGFALVVLFTVINIAIVNKRGAAAWKAKGKVGSPPELEGNRAFALFAISALSYVVWTCALPDTPFLDITGQATLIGGFAALVVAALVPKLAELLNLSPPND